MIDFHSHMLPGVDDGADSLKASLSMLWKSFLQGVDVVVLTPHFYGDREYPQEFLRRRNRAYKELEYAMLMSPVAFPPTILGAEVLYFPGISEAEEMAQLKIGNSDSILIEPPMVRWTDEMLDEIAQMGENFGCVPVIAHVDRYMRYLEDMTLMERVRERNMMVQVNAEYFLRPETAKDAVKNLKKGNIHLLGSDCHNLDTRPPNLGLVKSRLRQLDAYPEFQMLHQNARELLRRRGERT